MSNKEPQLGWSRSKKQIQKLSVILSPLLFENRSEISGFGCRTLVIFADGISHLVRQVLFSSFQRVASGAIEDK